MKVKFTNLFKLIIEKKKIFNKINSLIKNANFVGGSEINSFETEFANFLNIKYCIAVANGTDALEIAIKSFNFPEGSEIVVPNNTWISTAEAVVSNSHRVVFCDINLDDYTMCLDDLKKKITSKTKAIIPVHLYGNPVNVNEIKKIIKNRDIKIIEDCAQAHGSRLEKKHVGTLGDIGTFSFFPGKNLGSFGDGGAIVTNNKKIYEYCLRARNHGAIKKYEHFFSGRNSRLDTIHAGVLRIKLKKYYNVVKKRNYLANLYFQELKNINNLELFKLSKNKIYSFHQFVIRTKYRDDLMFFLKKSGIETMIHYPYMLNELKFFNYFKKMKNSKSLGKKILSLPISEEHSKDEILYICKKIKVFFNKKKFIFF